jgi:hypothetical protein
VFICPDVTLFFSQGLIKIKTNIRRGKYVESREVIYIFQVIEYQYHGLPQTHFIFHLDNAHDMDANNHEDLIAFVHRNFIEELPQFDGDEFQNIHW